MKWALVVAAAIVALAIAAVVFVPVVADIPRVQALIAGSASQTIGRPVRFSAIVVRPLPLPSVELKGLEIGDDPRFGAAPFLKLEKGTLRLGLLALLAGRVEVSRVILTQPSITLLQDAGGHWNIATLGAGADARSGSARAPRAGSGGTAGSGPGVGGPGVAGTVLGSRIRIDRGVVSYALRGGIVGKYRIEDLNLKLKSSGTQVTAAGDLRVRPGDLRVRIARGSLALPAARTPLLDSAVQADVSLDGKDVGALMEAAVGPAPAVAGAITGTLVVTGSLGAPRVAGKVELPGLQITQTRQTCPEPRKRTLTVSGVTLNVHWEGAGVQARPFTASLGRGKITTNVTASFEGSPRMTLSDVVVKGVPLETLVDFLCQGYVVTGPLDLTGTFSMKLKGMWKTLAGEGQLSIGPGKVVGPQAVALFENLVRAGGALSSVLAPDVPTGLGASPLEFDAITATYQIVDGVVTTRDLLYTTRTIKVGVTGQYALASGAMNLDVVVNHQRGRIAAKVTGTVAAPSIQVAPSALVRDLDPDKLQRGLQDLLKRFR